MSDVTTYIVRFEKFNWREHYYREAKRQPIQITTAMTEGEVPPPNFYMVDYKPIEFKNPLGSERGQVFRFFVPDNYFYSNFGEIFQALYDTATQHREEFMISEIAYRDDLIARNFTILTQLLTARNPLQFIRLWWKLKKEYRATKPAREVPDDHH